MSNVLAIAQKELRSYFFSPIAYVVIGFFVFIFGYFFAANLAAFLASDYALNITGQAINVNGGLRMD